MLWALRLRGAAVIAGCVALLPACTGQRAGEEPAAKAGSAGPPMYCYRNLGGNTCYTQPVMSNAERLFYYSGPAPETFAPARAEPEAAPPPPPVPLAPPPQVPPQNAPVAPVERQPLM